MGRYPCTRVVILPFGGKGDSHYILPQQIDRYRQKNDILHKERDVAGHGRKPTRRRVPTIRHERDDGDGTYECGTGTQSPKNPNLLFQKPKNRSVPNVHSETPKNQVAPRMPKAG